jgi:hypothetical protein
MLDESHNGTVHGGTKRMSAIVTRVAPVGLLLAVTVSALVSLFGR